MAFQCAFRLAVAPRANYCIDQYLHHAREPSIPWQVVKVRQFRFRALITLDPAAPRPATLHPPARQYPNHTHALMIQAHDLRTGYIRYFPAELCSDSEQPLHPGDRAVVTITVTDDEASAFFGAGQRFTLWSGGDVGHGTISRRVFTDNSPS
jgi:hypothetical protein